MCVYIFFKSSVKLPHTHTHITKKTKNPFNLRKSLSCQALCYIAELRHPHQPNNYTSMIPKKQNKNKNKKNHDCS
uniref:Uncharacterized protein n=1 Tax=Anguilla anguilla TaxID=7936 RepID=A0A0E9Q9G6_ANGAN